MKTIEIKLYKFNELSEKSQEKAIEKHCDINVHHEWWEYIFDDAKSIGIKINEFDIYHKTIDCEKHYMPQDMKRLILKTHGKNCETYKTVKKHDLRNEQNCEEMFHELCQDYLILLEKDYDYLISKEAIIEAIIENEYDFTEDGRMY